MSVNHIQDIELSAEDHINVPRGVHHQTDDKTVDMSIKNEKAECAARFLNYTDPLRNEPCTGNQDSEPNS